MATMKSVQTGEQNKIDDVDIERPVVVFGAGPTGLGATIWLKLREVEHVVAAADVIPERLETALAVGADAVSNSATEDATAGRGRRKDPRATSSRPRPALAR